MCKHIFIICHQKIIIPNMSFISDYRRYKLNSQAVLANSLVYFFILTLFLGISISASAQNRDKQRRIQLFQMKVENTQVSAAESFALQVLKSSKKQSI